MPHTSPRSTLRSAALILTIAGLALSGCNRTDADAKAIEAASIQLSALNAGLGSAPAPDRREKVYSGVLSSLKDAAGSDSAAHAAAANLLLAKAHAGLAETPAAEAAAMEADALNRARVIRADLAQWIELSAMAEAADRYDPTAEIRALESQVAEIQQAIEGLKRARTDVASRHEGLTGEAEQLSARVRAIRDEIGQMRMRATTVSATEAAEIAEQARVRGREADGLDMQASRLLAQAAPLEPQIAEIDLNIAGLENQIASLRAAQDSARQRAQNAKDEAAETRERANAAAQRLDAQATELNALREGTLAAAYDKAANALTSASSAARKAASDNRSASKLAEGTALQMAGDLHWQRAHGLREHALLMQALATATPALPRSGAYEGNAAAADKARGETLTLAADAYQQAKDALSATGAKGEAAERLQKVDRMLDLIIQATQGQAVDWAAADRPAPQREDSYDDESYDDATDASGEAPDLAATIQQWMDSLQAGDTSFIADAIYTDIPALSNSLDSIGRIAAANARLDALCTEQFGQSMTEFAMAQGQAGALGMGGLPDLSQFSIDSLDIQSDGDTAEVRSASDPSAEPMRFRLVRGRWRLDLSRDALPPEFAQVEPMLGQVMGVLPAMADAMDETISETESGAYNSTQAVFVALNQKLMPIMAEMMGGMQPPGGN